MKNDFEIHPRLREDCHVLGSLEDCDVLLHRNAALPWLILVPHTDALELFELEPALRAAVERAADALARCLKTRLGCAKINVAAIGNLVPQLHVHIVGRHAGDACWPQPVWGHLRPGPGYAQTEIAALKSELEKSAGLLPA